MARYPSPDKKKKSRIPGFFFIRYWYLTLMIIIIVSLVNGVIGYARSIPNEVDFNSISSQFDAATVLEGSEGSLRIGLWFLASRTVDSLLIIGQEETADLARAMVQGSPSSVTCCTEIFAVTEQTTQIADRIALWANRTGAQSIILMAPDYQLMRLQAHISGKSSVVITPYPVTTMKFDRTRWAGDLVSLQTITNEYLTYLKDKMTGAFSRTSNTL